MGLYGRRGHSALVRGRSSISPTIGPASLESWPRLRYACLACPSNSTRILTLTPTSVKCPFRDVMPVLRVLENSMSAAVLIKLEYQLTHLYGTHL